MKRQIVLPNLNDLDEVLDGLPGNFTKIRELRSRLDEPLRGLFDKTFLLGLREGIFLNLNQEVNIPNSGRDRYVRLAPTTSYRVPDCYGEYKIAPECKLCSVGSQCKAGEKLEER